MKISFFGSSRYVLPIIAKLKENFDLALVVTTEKKATDPVPAYCAANQIKCLSVSSLADPSFSSQLSICNSVIAVLASFGLIIPKSVLELFQKGIINLHPSLLPQYRGPTPVQQAILDGKTQTGVTVMLLDQQMDHGPIFKQAKINIAPDATAASLYQQLFKLGANLLPKIITDYLAGKIQAIPQDHSQATYTKILTREDGYIDLNKFSILNLQFSIDRLVRAYFPWPGVWTKFKINQQELRIKFLPGNQIQVEGKKAVNYQDFLNGYPEAKQLWLQLGLSA